MPDKKINVQGLQIRVQDINDKDYISLTDIAKRFNNDNPSSLIVNWMRNKDTVAFLGVWETINNPDFNLIEFDKIKNEAGYNRFVISSSKWILKTGAIGIQSKAGRYGGTYAHKDIALGFCYWLSPPFQIYLITEFQRLKEEDSERQNLEWHISKLTDNVDEMRNLLDTIPGQKQQRNRISKKSKK